MQWLVLLLGVISFTSGSNYLQDSAARNNNVPDLVVGLIRPIRWVKVSAEIDGRIAERCVEEHTPLKRGDLILRIDETIVRAALNAAEAAHLEADARYTWAQADLERARELLREDTTGKAEYDRALAAERMARAAVLAAEAKRQEARHRLDRATLTAPFAGVLAQIDVETGEYVTPGRFLFSLMDLKEVKIESWVDAAGARLMNAGDKLRLAVDGGEVESVVVSVAPGTDNESRTFKVILKADNREMKPGQWLLRPGCTVTWTLPQGVR